MMRETVVILGIPIDNLNMDETVKNIFIMIDNYEKDGCPRQVATVNVDFVVNTLKWGLKNSRHPELLDILRRADLVTPDGMPIVWTSKLLGNPLKERVTGADLVPQLAKEAARQHKSIYFLGGNADSAEKASVMLRERFPGLTIAGTGTPYVQIEGEALAEVEADDQPVVDEINRSGADILLIAFGNPKQELWFERNRGRLRVPVSIGIGGSFEFITGTVKRAPVWMQKAGVEWIYRIVQDPARLWKRYFVGFFKFGMIVLPSILYYRYRLLLLNRRGNKNVVWQSPGMMSRSSSRVSVKVIVMPERLDAGTLRAFRNDIEPDIAKAMNLVFDFSRTSFIDSTGLGFLVKVKGELNRSGKKLLFAGIHSQLMHFFELSRTWDLFKENTSENAEEAIGSLDKTNSVLPFYYVLENGIGHRILKLFGRLDAAQVSGLDVTSIINEIGLNDCIVDLDNLDFVDSSGLVLFFKIKKYLSSIKKHCVLCSLNDSVQQVFHITRLDRFFAITKNSQVARHRFEVSG